MPAVLLRTDFLIKPDLEVHDELRYFHAGFRRDSHPLLACQPIAQAVTE